MKNKLINQIPRLKSSTPAERCSAPLDSLPMANSSSQPPVESGGATHPYPSSNLKNAIVKEINNYSECTQVLALKQMLSRLKKESAND